MDLSLICDVCRAGRHELCDEQDQRVPHHCDCTHEVVPERISTFEQAPPYPVQRPYDWNQHRCARCKVDRLLSHAAWHEHMIRVHRIGGIPITCPGDTCEGAWPTASDEEKRSLTDYLRLMLLDVKWDSRALFEDLVNLRRKYQHVMDFPKPQPSSAGSPNTRRRDTD